MAVGRTDGWEGDGIEVALLDGLEIRRGGDLVELGLPAERLVAFVALHERPLSRVYLAGVLWTDVDETRSTSSLRSALWRLNREVPGLIQAHGRCLRLGSAVLVDARRLLTAGERVLDRGAAMPDAMDLALLLNGDLLPDWYDDWVTVERERFHQLQLHALETLSDRLCEQGRAAEAVLAGTAAVRSEPLRESAHRAVIRAHLAHGNQAEAVRQYQLFQRLLSDSIGLGPTEQMLKLVRPLTAHATAG